MGDQNDAPLTLFHMTMGQYDPDCQSLSFIATISVLGFQKFMTLFLLKLCMSLQGHFLRFFSKKVEKLHFEKFRGSSRLR